MDYLAYLIRPYYSIDQGLFLSKQMSITVVDSMMNEIKNRPSGLYYRFPNFITKDEWKASIRPRIEELAQQHKLLLQTLTVFTPQLGAFFIKKVDTPEYLDELKSYYLYLTKGPVKGSCPPPTYKTKHLAQELARNLRVKYGINVKAEKVLCDDGTHHEYELKKCE